MIDKIKGNNNKPPDLRKKGDDNDIMKRVKGLVDKLTGTRKEPSKKPRKRPMPRPRLRVGKKEEKPRLKPPKKPPERKLGLTPPGKPPSRGMRPKIPEEDQRTLVGAIVFGIIIIIIVASGYYFLVYQPYQQTLQAAKDQKIAEVDAYFKGPLATDPQKQAILAEIDSGQTPEEVLAVDVLGPATKSWRRYQTQEINTKKDKFNRVMVVYNVTENGNQSESKRVIMKASDAQKIVNEADATVLANMVIQTPDTVAVPIMISRLQAAGGLIGVGSMVDVYLNVNQTGNNTTVTSQETTPRISGATVLAILRAKDSGSVDASILRSQNISINTMSMEKKTTTDVEQLLRAAAAGGLSEEDIRAILQNYGIRLSDYERAANLGELDTTYLVILEVPRDDVPFLIQNMNSIILTVPTQNAPEWMIRELHKIYG
ncbi:DUF515 domain-containing protein [Methanothermobacter tenebrarum]